MATHEIGMLITCLADVMRPRLAETTLQLLREVRCNPIVPQAQTCCGQPALNAGRRDDARKLARKLATEFNQFQTVVAPSGSCIGALRTHVTNLFPATEPGATEVLALANKCRELSQFLLERGYQPNKHPQPKRVAFHDSCAGLRELGIHAGPRALLTAAGHELVPLRNADVCCGFGGSFAVKFGAVSGQLADNKCADALSSEADVLAMGDLGCILNIEGRMRRRGEPMPIVHWAELLLPD